jgi:2-dehydro-3-deoxyphosphogluconate aldolase/(4S)-4-hydroxy-2-oxoglutarate aldolase
MTIEDAIQRIDDVGIIPVIRASSGKEAQAAVEIICEAGINVIEITMTVPDAPEVIGHVVRHHSKKVLVGAGTVVTTEQAERCLDAGAEFLVGPGLAPRVLHLAAARHKLAIPGALSPTEYMNARAEGARLVKIFPCGGVGGPKYLKSFRAPFPDAALIPTGGVNLSNAAEYILAGAFALGVGADLVDLPALMKGESQKILETAKALVKEVRRARDLGTITKHTAPSATST